MQGPFTQQILMGASLGVPIYDVPLLASKRANSMKQRQLVTGKQEKAPTERTPAEIQFVKRQILFGRAALNKHGQVIFGLKHTRKFWPRYGRPEKATAKYISDVLNRCPHTPATNVQPLKPTE